MKRFTVILLAALFACQTAGAQSLGDLLKMLGFGGSSQTEQVAENPKPALTAEGLLGRWRYAEPASRYDGSDMLGSFGVKAVETMLPSVYAKAGLSEGSAAVTFTAPDTVSGQIGDYTLTGRYTFDESSGTLTVSATIGGVDGVLHGTAALENGVLTLLFDAQEAASVAERVSSRVASNDKFQMMKSLLNSYPGVKMGCRMRR